MTVENLVHVVEALGAVFDDSSIIVRFISLDFTLLCGL